MTTVAPPAPVSLPDFYAALPRLPGGTLPLSADQRRAVEHDFALPLWVIAGPGTGKTHTLVWLTLKRLLVDGVPPQRLMLTTFTRKAATELRTRLIHGRQALVDAGLRGAGKLDLSQVMLGTLHELASDVLQRERYPETLRVRLLGDELTQQFFVRRTRNPLMDCDDLKFWQRFSMCKDSDVFPPNKAKRAEFAGKLFNRMTENSVDLGLMRASGEPHFILLVGAYERYLHDLHAGHRTDQSLMQRHFLEYLKSPAGQAWVADGLTVVVDEYQDTNPIQEEIYFTLAGGRGDLTVVGDDDQSLYRFRGATVEALTNYDDACQHFLGRKPAPLYLTENRRSHPQIVAWVNAFIGGHPEMNDPVVRVRAPGKPPLVARADVSGTYPAVAVVAEADNPTAAGKVAGLVADLVHGGLVSDASQVALLTFSTRESTQGIGAYTDAIRAQGLEVYNPRSKQAHLDARALALVGAFSVLLDPDYAPVNLVAPLPRGVPEYLVKARTAFQDLLDTGRHDDLWDYVVNSQEAVRQSTIDPDWPYLTRTGKQGEVTLSSLLFKLLSYEPFASDLRDPAIGERLKALNLILAEYEALFSDGRIKLAPHPGGGAQVDGWTLYNFYSVFVEGFHDGLNDPEDAEASLQPGMVNVMTIHQSKGLEFEVVIVLRPDRQPFVSDTHQLEDEFHAFSQSPTRPARRRTQDERAAEDTIRLFFVAYSRARRLLVVAGQLTPDTAPAWDRVMGGAYASGLIRQKNDLTTLGAHPL
ncbi:UvrD-helicase domain-containing protein [Deinococcus knuensis]|uniref:DNA 3'-5' helicase n=1 Tax=Deinococcus knuensis TaxID=1837380 RepID=A0ABQ2STI3_9DEIO|nr:ATP-dependent helicase [Deinococcus knuensis]GGS37539.1 DNA helicase [Deinococcus knuensis]